MKKTVIYVLGVLLLTGCAGSLYDQININNLDPVVSHPSVESYAVEHGISLSWGNDPGTEEYAVYRDTDPAGNFSKIVYQGNSLDFTDMGVQDDQFYYYKLGKIRGKKLFGPSVCMAGRTGSIRKDIYEPNDTKNTAVLLDDITQANIFYCQDGKGYYLEDRDWYKVELGSRKYMVIKIDGLDTGNLNNEDIFFNIEGGQTSAVSNGNEFSIYNYDYQKKTVFFQITVNKNQILGSPTDPGGKIGSYRINIIQVNNILPVG